MTYAQFRSEECREGLAEFLTRRKRDRLRAEEPIPLTSVEEDVIARVFEQLIRVDTSRRIDIVALITHLSPEFFVLRERYEDHHATGGVK